MNDMCAKLLSFTHAINYPNNVKTWNTCTHTKHPEVTSTSLSGLSAECSVHPSVIVTQVHNFITFSVQPQLTGYKFCLNISHVL